MSLDLTDDKSTLVQVMAWCRQATSHYLSQCWPRSMSQYGVTRPQWVNSSLQPLLEQRWLIVNGTQQNELQWNLDEDGKMSFQENASKQVICKMAAILFKPSCSGPNVLMALVLTWNSEVCQLMLFVRSVLESLIFSSYYFRDKLHEPISLTIFTLKFKFKMLFLHSPTL